MIILNVFMCTLIGVFGCGIWFLMNDNKNKLTRIQINLSSVAVKDGESVHDETVGPDGKLRVRHAEATVYDLSAIENNRRDFNSAYAHYVRNGQLIAILPLLGIFGTVFGLILGTRAVDITQLMSGLGTAMWTTAIGLVFSIGLKIYDAWTIGVLVNAIDAEFASKDAIIERQTLIDKASAVQKMQTPEEPK